MAFPADTWRDDLDTESMGSISWEEGLQEIDSFFNSSPDGRNSTVGEHMNDPAPANSNAPAGGDTAATAFPTLQPQEETKPTNGETKAQPDQPTDADEFATLMQDLDQVTASETSQPDPKYRFDFILNSRHSPAPNAAPPASSNDKPVRGSTGAEENLSPEVNEESAKEDEFHTTPSDVVASSPTKRTEEHAVHEPPQPRPDFRPNIVPGSLASLHAEKGLSLLSPRRGRPIGAQETLSHEGHEESDDTDDKTRATSAEAITALATKTTEQNALSEPPETQAESHADLVPVPLASLHAEKGLSLLSPRRGRPIEPTPSSASNSPLKDMTGSSPSLLPSLPNEEKLPPATPGQDIADEAAMSDHPVPRQKSPAIPSSAGKSSLMEEMRNEKQESAGLIVSAAGSMVQPNLVAVAREDQNDYGPALAGQRVIEEANIAQQKAEALMKQPRLGLPAQQGHNAYEQALTGQQIIEEADIAQEKAKALVTSSRKEVKPSPEMSDITNAEETNEDTEVVEGAHADDESVPKPNDNAKGKAPAAKATKTTKATKATKKITEKQQQAKPVPQRRKSGRNQPPVQYDEETSDEADEDTKIKAPPEPTVPAKRKAKASPVPQNKRAKKGREAHYPSFRRWSSRELKASESARRNVRPSAS